MDDELIAKVLSVKEFDRYSIRTTPSSTVKMVNDIVKEQFSFINWIRQQGTQRGILMVVGGLLTLFQHQTQFIEKDVLLEIIAGLFLVIGTHDAITEG